MEIAGTHRFRAGRQVVWEALLDPAALKKAIPGCERLDMAGAGRFEMVVRVGMAAVKGTYRGDVTLSDVRAPGSYSLSATAVGDLGTTVGEAVVELVEEGDATVVRYRGDLRAQGGLARLGGRVLQGSASLLLAQFFKAMDAQVAQRIP